MVCTAGDAPGDWLNILLRERDMLEAESGWFGFRDARLAWLSLEVRDECSSGDFADGVGYGGATGDTCGCRDRGSCYSCCHFSWNGVLPEIYGGNAAAVCAVVDGGAESAIVAGT